MAWGFHSDEENWLSFWDLQVNGDSSYKHRNSMDSLARFAGNNRAAYFECVKFCRVENYTGIS